MDNIPIFAIPVSSQSLPRRTLQTTAKRKRGSETPQVPLENAQSYGLESSQLAEYTAVVTPTERSQRRLAGIPVNQIPPPPPFPHAPPKPSHELQERSEEKRHDKSPAQPSLHSQHLAALTALLHRSMLAKDYGRARRALGLLLRDETGGRPVDIRTESLWGIGGEILFRQDAGYDHGAVDEDSGCDHISREGLERAKLYYERLMIQYPQHKSWPDAVNALDFCIALFGLWIYVINQESLRLQERASANEGAPAHNTFDLSLPEVKIWELREARAVAEALDKRMLNVPFNGNVELTRLRAMIALWTADLLAACAEHDAGDEVSHNSIPDTNDDDLSDHVERMYQDHTRSSHLASYQYEAAKNKDLARTLLSKAGKVHGESFADIVPRDSGGFLR